MVEATLRFVKKILVEIIKLLWKLVKLAFWKWLKPMLVPIVIVAIAIFVFVVVVGILLAGAC